MSDIPQRIQLHLLGDINLLGVVARDFAARFDPRLQTAMQRADFFVAFVHQQAGDTRRARFIGSTAIDDDVAIGQHGPEMRFRESHVHWN